MPDLLAEAFATEGIGWLVVAVFVAGLVRGFAGFGSAMIIMPVAASVLSPIEAVLFVSCAELVGPLPNIRSCMRQGDLRDVLLLGAGAAFALPLGVWALVLIDPVVFGWFVSTMVFGLLALVMLGWRYRGALTLRLKMLTGGLGGFMTGFAGLPGPPVIMLYMASTLPISVIRANLTLYLVVLDLMLLPLLWLTGLMVWKIALLGLVIGIPNLIGNAIGARLFDPRAEGLFRIIAYIIIGCSGILGLPLWKG